ncbi:MAG: hypothetical protein LBT10_01870 [Methanobrevibacter sp.]|jgi:hypothetical protein|nr:hypothetical protein [Methanobrevibacter sp.]
MKFSSYQDFLGLDNATYTYMTPQIEAYEKSAFHAISTQTLDYLTYETFTNDPTIYEQYFLDLVEGYLQRAIYLMYYPEIAVGIQNIYMQEQLIRLNDIDYTSKSAYKVGG